MPEGSKVKGLNVSLRDFDRDILSDIKDLNDRNGGKREWLANVYFKDGNYTLGSPVMGDYNGVSMHPDEQAVKDKVKTGIEECMDEGHDKGACKRIVKEQVTRPRNVFSAFGGKRPNDYGVDEEELVTTIHLHPMRLGEMNKNLREQFSGTDIGSEFAKSIRDGQTRNMFLTFPEKKGWKQHNKVKLITFPGRASMEIMKSSNPHLTEQQMLSITPDGDNIDTVDWYAYQDECKRRGLLEEIDVEQRTGYKAYSSYSNYWATFAVIGIAGAIGIAMYLNWRKGKKNKVK